MNLTIAIITLAESLAVLGIFLSFRKQLVVAYKTLTTYARKLEVVKAEYKSLLDRYNQLVSIQKAFGKITNLKNKK